MYIPPVAHIKRTFGGRGEAGKYSVYSQRDHIHITTTYARKKSRLAHAHLVLRLENP